MIFIFHIHNMYTYGVELYINMEACLALLLLATTVAYFGLLLGSCISTECNPLFNF